MAKIYIPSALRQYSEGRDVVEVEAATVGEALAELTSQYSELRKHLFNEQGKLRSFVNIYVGDEDIRHLDNEQTQLREADEISIIPSIAGGVCGLQQLVELSKDEVERYSRHLILPEVGMEGQKKLKASSVLLIGVGGLGSPLALYLAAVGVGRIGLVDFDNVDRSNLQRQVIYGTKDVGRPKLVSAKDRVNDVNPHVQVETHELALSSENALRLFSDYDVIADGTDNFPTRYLVNDACVLTGKPNVYGSIFKFEGQASVFYAKEGPCYRCLYPEPPPPGLVPSCAEGGVLGILPGVIGLIQATEVIKLILGCGELLIGRLLLFDALRMKFREMKLRKNPSCPLCGPNATITKLIDYQQFCGITRKVEESMTDITVEELKRRIDAGERPFILDVREPHEYQICRLDGAVLIPLGQLQNRLVELDPEREIVVHCKLGGRSAKAAALLRSAGFKNVKNLLGGIDAWAQKVDPKMPRY
ncbi:MAG: molybdopterin-synthase adenylyltransferase MoeB [Acidobacteriota bacterium]|nr:molybdopterin-synthase adenylyltransferase MoeB [Blastocatellia bacterium]MDW8411977.1 molybdopterin-synthase adenylyltransferase MoeB [Acidobacteriota bacterium]